MSPKGWSVGFSNFSTLNDFGTTTNGSLAFPHHANILILPIFHENHVKERCNAMLKKNNYDYIDPCFPVGPVDGFRHYLVETEGN